MPKLNENYRKLKDSYLFAEIAHRTAAYMEKHPEQSLIRLGTVSYTHLDVYKRQAYICD